MQKKTLNEISIELARFWHVIDEYYAGNILEMPDQEIAKYLTLGDAHRDKVDNWIQFLDGLEAEIEVYKKREEEAKRLKKSRQNLLDRLKSHLVFLIEAHPELKFEGELGELKIKLNPASLKYVLPSTKFTKDHIIDSRDLEKFPELKDFAYEIKLTALDTENLKEKLKAGKEIYGARLEKGKALKW